MKTLEYYWSDGTHTVFDNYTIDEESVVKNIKTGQVMTHHKNGNGYNVVCARHEGRQYNIRVARALASTFIGPPPTLQHTADHEDKNRSNDVLDNIRWSDKTAQTQNQTRPCAYKSSFIVIKDNVERSAKEWEDFLKNEVNPYNRRYTSGIILHYAQHNLFGFRYKTYKNLPREVWKVVKGSQNKKGEWLISSKSRMKYKTPYAENVFTADQLGKSHGYPVVRFNGKRWNCHELSFMTFRPNEYATKTNEDIILHKNDEKLDFSPFRLRFGNRSDNRFDAYNNGKHNNTKSARKPVASYIDGTLEKEHESIHAAVRYLREHGYPRAGISTVSTALSKVYTRYGRTWKQ